MYAFWNALSSHCRTASHLDIHSTSTKTWVFFNISFISRDDNRIEAAFDPCSNMAPRLYILHGPKSAPMLYTLCMYRIVSSHRAEYRDLSVASRSIICPSRRQRQIIIDLQDTDKSRYFAITEFNNCFIIRSPSLRKHPFVLALRRWGCFAFLRANVPSGEERGETVVFADYRSPSLFFNEYLREAKRSAIFHVRAISRRRIRKA